MTNCAVILAGGQGKRMKAEMPKPMFKVLGETMLEWVISACEKAGVDDICIVKGYKSEIIDEYIGNRYKTALQSQRLGTGHAVMQSVPFLEESQSENTLVLCGDAPFIDSETIKLSLDEHIKSGNAVTVISACLDNPYGYGRIVRCENGISAIVEQKDANEEQLKICEINSGCYWFDTKQLVIALSKLDCNNAANEYYLTDTISILISQGQRAGAYMTENSEVVLGANDRKGLLALNDIARRNVIEKHLENGVEFTCTDGVVIERDVEIGVGTHILQGTVLSKGTKIGKNCVIGPNCIFENAVIGDNTKLNYVQGYDCRIDDNVKIGPFVHIRPNSHIKNGVKIGDFVEIKNSVIGENTSVSHLTYIGDSDVGARVNFGCGTVTSNYDGVNKYRTTIGDNCFIGCNTNLIAPVKLGKGAYTAAGTTVVKDVPDYALALDRGEFRLKDGYSLKKLGEKATREN